jgi:flavin reductase (DIM6/NTAB) family NADH-FMN oxidoreductase RutF
VSTFDFDGPHLDEAYGILASLIIPRPIALVTTVDTQGVVNAAPFSFFNLLGVEPPIVALGIGNRADGSPKDTARNLLANQECVIHLVHPEIANQMNLCAASLPYGQSELPLAGFTTIASQLVKPPRLAEAQVALECRLLQELQIGENRLLVAQIHLAHVADVLVCGESEIDSQAWAPIGRLASPHFYCHTQPRFEIVRPG